MKRMRIKFAAVLFSFFVFGCAAQPFKNWTKSDTARQVIYSGLHVLDWAQTREAAKKPELYQEEGLLYYVAGSHPSTSEVDLYFGTTLVLQTAIPAMLKPKYRHIWQYFWIGAEAANAVKNWSVGLHGSF